MSYIDKNISFYLSQLFAERDDMTIDYIWYKIEKKLSRDTIDRAKKGKGKLRERSARILADFIEEETQGKRGAKHTLEYKPKDFRDADLRKSKMQGANLVNADLSRAKLDDADLEGAKIEGAHFTRAQMNRANFVNTKGNGVNFSLAQMRGCTIETVEMNEWDLSYADLQGALVNDCHNNQSISRGVIFTDALITKMKWYSGGSKSQHMVLPESVPFETWVGGGMNHSIIAQILKQAFPQDKEIGQAVNYITGSPSYRKSSMPHWVDFVSFSQRKIPTAIDRMLACFGQYPKIRLLTRWNRAEKQL